MPKPILLIAGVLCLAGAVIVPIGATIITFILPSAFASTTRILPTVTEPNAIATEVEIIRSKVVLLPVVTNLHLTRTWGEKYREGELPVDLTYMLLSRSCTIKQAKGTHLIEISVLSDDNLEAAAIANEIARVYTKSLLAARGTDPKATPQIVDEATPSWRPAKPNKFLNIASGFGVGLVLGLIGIWLILKGRRRGRTPRVTPSPPPI